MSWVAWPLIAVQAGIMTGFAFALGTAILGWRRAPPTWGARFGVALFLAALLAMPAILANLLGFAVAGATTWLAGQALLPIFAAVSAIFLFLLMLTLDRRLDQVGGALKGTLPRLTLSALDAAAIWISGTYLGQGFSNG